MFIDGRCRTGDMDMDTEKVRKEPRGEAGVG